MKLIKKITVAVFVLTACAVFADQEVVLDSKIKVDEYTASISGKPGCKMPTDVAHPKAGECEVKTGRLETGWKLIKVGDTCYRETIALIKWEKFSSGVRQIEAPETESRRESVKCPA